MNLLQMWTVADYVASNFIQKYGATTIPCRHLFDKYIKFKLQRVSNTKKWAIFGISQPTVGWARIFFAPLWGEILVVFRRMRWADPTMGSAFAFLSIDYSKSHDLTPQWGELRQDWCTIPRKKSSWCCSPQLVFILHNSKNNLKITNYQFWNEQICSICNICVLIKWQNA